MERLKYTSGGDEVNRILIATQRSPRSAASGGEGRERGRDGKGRRKEGKSRRGRKDRKKGSEGVRLGKREIKG